MSSKSRKKKEYNKIQEADQSAAPTGGASWRKRNKGWLKKTHEWYIFVTV